MKIIYIHQYFKTPLQSGGTRSYEFAKIMHARGHDVHMITSYNDTKFKQEIIEGLNIYWLPVSYHNQFGAFKRVISFLKFMFLAFKTAYNIKDADICYASSTPLTVGVIAMMLKKFKKIPFVFEVRDLWPEVLIQMKFIKSPILKKLAYRLEKSVYAASNSIVVLSPGMALGVQKYQLNKEIHLLPNSADLELFKPQDRPEHLIETLDLTNKNGIIYFGTINKTNHLEYFIQLAKCSQNKKYNHLKFFLVGEGSEVKRILEMVKELKLENFVFLESLPKILLNEVLNIMDFSYISFLKLPVLQTNSPNKFFDSLSAGKICIVNTEGWLKNLVEENNCGLYADPENHKQAIEEINNLINDPIKMKNLATNARILAEKEFDRLLLAGKLVDILEQEIQ